MGCKRYHKPEIHVRVAKLYRGLDESAAERLKFFGLTTKKVALETFLK